MQFPTWPNPKQMNSIKLGLDRIEKLLEKLDNPHKKLPPIFHIAGTNGKGSTSAFIKYILEGQGYKVHRNTSPHLVRFNERIEVSSKEITDDYYYELADECRFVIEKYNLEVSYFEIITAIAFMAFSRNEADATILEVGLGGRLDASNIIKNSAVSIITPISLDHTKILGDTLDKIAIEKISIAKNNCPIIVSKQENIVNETIKQYLQDNNKNCPTYFFGKDYTFKKISDFECEFTGFSQQFKTKLPNLEGEHQIINAGTAIASILCQNQLKIDTDKISNGINKTFWKGRLQNLINTKLQEFTKRDSELYLDGGHNEGGAITIKNWVENKNKQENRENVLIISMLERKDTRSFINIIKNTFDKVIIVSNQNGTDKYKSIEDFTNEFKEFGVDIFYGCNNIIEALQKTKEIQSDKKLRILMCGSLYFCGDVLSLIESY